MDPQLRGRTGTQPQRKAAARSPAGRGGEQPVRPGKHRTGRRHAEQHDREHGSR